MILAVDPGLGSCGWAIVRPKTGRVVDLGVLVSKPTPHVDEWTDRTRRASRQAKVLGDLIEKYDCDTIAAEAVSCGGPPCARFSMGTSLCLSWGVLLGLAEGMDAHVFEVTPKQWQHAITPHAAKIDYDEIFGRITAFVDRQAGDQLRSITKALRNHALDAVGVGVFTALLPNAVRIREQRVTA